MSAMIVWVAVSDCCGSCGRVCAIFDNEGTAEAWLANPPEHDRSSGMTCYDGHELERFTVHQDRSK